MLPSLLAREIQVSRHEHDCWLLERVKLVRADFIQQIAGHWRRRSLESNRLHDAAVHG